MSRLKLSDIRHGLLCVPESYVDLRQVHRVLPPIGSDEASDLRLYILRVSSVAGFDDQKRALSLRHNGDWARCRRLEITLKDERDQSVIMTVFGGVWAYRDTGVGEEIAMIGRVQRAYGRVQLQDAVSPPAHAIGRIWVRYAGIPGQVSGESVTNLVRSQMDDPDAYRVCAAHIVGELGMRASQALSTLGCDDVFSSFEDMLRALHDPQDPDHGWLALCAAHKVTSMAIQASALRHNTRHVHRQAPLPVSAQEMMQIAATQPEELTQDQVEVSKAILTRLADPTPLNGLLSGDVGTGKTLAYLLPAVAAHRAGGKVAIIAPTMILADQIARQIATRFHDVIGGVERIEAGGKIKNASSIIVGTSGLITVAARKGYEPNLLIFDEQHKLSTTVRESLVKPWTHVLEVSATPIPRSIASALFGGRDVFNLRQCPVQKSFENHIVDVSERPQITAMMRQALASGGKVAVVYPRVRPAGPSDQEQPTQRGMLDRDAPQPEHMDVAQRMRQLGRVGTVGRSGAQMSLNVSPEEEQRMASASVIEGAKALEKAFPGRVVAVHGGMADADIALALNQLRSGEKTIVVASTVVETGVDIPSMTMMVVRDAHCFGISQLHQLRGRLVRNGGTGHFFMMVPSIESVSPETFMRLEAVREVNDGYLLAERDLAVRGFGEMAGVMQSGKSDTLFKLLRMDASDHLSDPDFSAMVQRLMSRSKLALGMNRSEMVQAAQESVALPGGHVRAGAENDDFGEAAALEHHRPQRGLF